MIDGIKFFNGKVTATQKVELPQNDKVQVQKNVSNEKNVQGQLDLKSMAAAIREANGTSELSAQAKNALKYICKYIDKFSKIPENKLNVKQAKYVMLKKVVDGEIDFDKTPVVSKIIKTKNGPILTMVGKTPEGKYFTYTTTGSLESLLKLQKNPMSMLKGKASKGLEVYAEGIIENLAEYYAQTHSQN